MRIMVAGVFQPWRHPRFRVTDPEPETAWWAPLSTRAKNCLWNTGIDSREKLVAFLETNSLPGLLRIRNLGWLTATEIVSWLLTGDLPADLRARAESWRAEMTRICAKRGWLV